MEDYDIRYLCTMIADLSGIPVRIFEDGEQIFYRSLVSLAKDPMQLCRDRIFAIKSHIGYLSTEHFYYYGVLNSGNLRIVVGPSGQVPHSSQELRELAFQLDISADDTEDFISAMKCIVQMPIESLLQILCTVNYVLNGEKKTLKDLAITASAQQAQEELSARKRAETLSADRPEIPQDRSLHNTYDLEQNMLSMIRRGDYETLSGWIAGAPAVRGGLLAPDQLRQRKNTFIVTATLASRSAIRGGLDIDEAFTLSDAYIRQCELMTAPDQIMNLQYHMILDFTDRVNRLRRGSAPTPLVLEVSNYIRRHISEAITAEAMAQELHLSRPYLSRRFREEAGETLTDRILGEKVSEAKRLLRYTDKSLAAIGLYLGFSSQSHFARVFKKYTELTPSEYRQKHASAGH